MILYSISLDDAEKYIGVTTKRLLCQRWGGHCTEARSGKTKNRALYNAMNKYGFDRFSINQIATPLSLDDMYKLECELIIDRRTHVSMGGYNITWGGQSGSHDNRPSGLDHHNTKITPEIVAHLRDPLLSEVVTAKFCDELRAAKIEISIASLNRARSGVTWRHLNEKYPPINPGMGARGSERRAESARRNLGIANIVLKNRRLKVEA